MSANGGGGDTRANATRGLMTPRGRATRETVGGNLDATHLYFLKCTT